MGMSASQARFLGLTARKNNVEFEGQQVNQQRTALSNQSANYYNDLLGMSVPIPPSIDDFSKTVYTFEDGALSNTITALIPSRKNDGTYSVSFLREYTDDFSVVSSASSVVQRIKNANGNTYNIGATTLRELGQISTTQTVAPQITIDGETYQVQQDAQGYYVNQTSTVTTKTPYTGDIYTDAKYLYYDAATGELTEIFRRQNANGDDEFYTVDEDGNETITSYTEDDLVMYEFDMSKPIDDYEEATRFITKNSNGEYEIETFTTETTQRYLTPSEVSSITTNTYSGTDPYLSNLSIDELNDLQTEELEYLNLLKEEFGTEDWLVRYVKDSTTGKYKPYFYSLDTLESTTYDDDKTGNSLSSVNCYTIGSKKKTEEIKNREGVRIEQDSTGRYINISFPQYDADGKAIAGSKMTTYSLTTNTMTDQEAYDDAMNQYEFEKYEYDQAINDINSKIEIVQAEDKNLELRLKQLDTEQKAISQELDSVSNVIQKNIESSFKTFG